MADKMKKPTPVWSRLNCTWLYLYAEENYSDLWVPFTEAALLPAESHARLHAGEQSAGSQLAGLQSAGSQFTGLQSAGLQFAGLQFGTEG